MLGRIFTVGGYTLLSRLTGFARDIMLAAILGAGPMADAFFVAFLLPNHFRAIFAEGAFNAAFVPAYAHVHGERGANAAGLFANRIFTLLFFSQLALLVVAWLFMPQALRILAPGFTDDAEQRRLAIELTRITFPYLLLITLVTLYGGMLNVMHRFASAAAASIFLNISMMSALYYAERLYQLPIGVIGIAIGTVLLPEMSQRITAGDDRGAAASQRRAFEFTLLATVPFVAAFLAVPDVIVRAVFARGAYTRA